MFEAVWTEAHLTTTDVFLNSSSNVLRLSSPCCFFDTFNGISVFLSLTPKQMEQQENVPLASSHEISPPRPNSVEVGQLSPSDARRSLVSTEHEAPQNSNEDDEIVSESNEKALDAVRHTSQLARSKHALTIFSCYAILAAFTWICTCIMVYRPLTTNRYGYGDKDKEAGYVEAAWPNKYVTNEHLYLALRFLQTVVAVLTIPTTSTICAQGAIIFMQRNKHNADLTLRQTIVLADKGWTDLGLLHSILHEGWERFGSRFLMIAVVLNFLGKHNRRWMYRLSMC